MRVYNLWDGIAMRKLIYSILSLILIGVMVFSGYKLLGEYLDARANRQSVKQLAHKAITTVSTVPTEPPQTQEDVPPEETQPPLEKPPIYVDFEAIHQEYPDVVGWFYCPETPINYPIVQGQDNDYYLHRLMDGTANNAGTLFMDYRNDRDFGDCNTIIYGHNMANKTMFGSIVFYKEQQYFEEHPVWYLLTPEHNYRMEIVAGFVTPETFMGYDFPQLPENMAEMVHKGKELSGVEFPYTPEEGEHLVMLSTCSYEFDYARFILLGALKEIG